MFSYITLALASVVSVSALAIPRDGAPAGYGSFLEDYDTYHARYLAIGCKGQQGTDFFEQCCHPRLASATLDTARLAQCTAKASSAVVSAPAASATSDPEDGYCTEGEEGCECDDEEGSSSSAAPAPTSTPQATPTPTSAKPAATPAPTAIQASSGGNGEVFSGGRATFFYQNGVAGACGTVHSDSDKIVALTGAHYGSFNKQSDNCGRQVQITRGNKVVNAKVADACPTCEGDNDLDLSQGAFDAIADEAEGQVPITWKFI